MARLALRSLLCYWACFFVAANVFVIGYEEPDLRSRFGVSYEAYTKQVRRWIPRFGDRSGAPGQE